MFHCTLFKDSTDSRHLVTVPFHQIIRSTTPLFVIALSIVFLRKSYSSQIYITLIPVLPWNMLLMVGYYWGRTGYCWRLLLHHPRLLAHTPRHLPCCHKNNPHKSNPKEHIHTITPTRPSPPHVPASMFPIHYLRLNTQ